MRNRFKGAFAQAGYDDMKETYNHPPRRTFMYKIYVIHGDKWYWMLARNKRILAHSEQYSSKTKAVKTAKNLNKAIPGSILVMP